MVDDGSKDDQFDDVDFDDLDDDLDGEDWDDFDDDPVADDSGALDDDSDDTGIAPPPKDKTFLQKNFNLIVVGVALLGGGALILPMLTGGDEASPTEQVAMMEDDAMDELPVLESQSDLDMAGSESLDDAVTNEPSNDFFADLDDGNDMGGDESADLLADDDSGFALDDDVLTPMPEADDSDVVLSSLDEELAEADELPDLNFDEALDEDAPVSADLSDSDDLMLDDPVSDEMSDLNLPADDGIAEIEQPVNEGASLDLMADEEVQLSDITAENDASSAEAIQEKDALIAKLQEENKNIETLNANMRTEIAALKEENELLKAGRDEKTSTNTAQAVEKPAKILESKPAPVVKTTAPKQVRKVEWVLKAAQPGQATISTKNSSDIRQIEVGSTVSGLGKITSIGLENGKWVVQGTSGRVSQ